jgi:hypothetical protein
MDQSIHSTSVFPAAMLSRWLQTNQTFHGSRIRVSLSQPSNEALAYIKEHADRQLPHVVMYLIDYAIDMRLKLDPDKEFIISNYNGLHLCVPLLWYERISDVAWEQGFVRDNGQLLVRKFMGMCIDASLAKGSLDTWTRFFKNGLDLIDRITMTLSTYVR